MKLIIDEKQCLKHKLTVEEVLVLLSLKYCEDTSEVVSNLEERKIITDESGKFQLTPGWADELDAILSDSSADEMSEERVLNLAQQMRQLYPRGKMPGSPYYYRCNSREIVLKLNKFFTVYGNYSDDKILDAEKRFLASFQGEHAYLPLLKYFIYKDKLVLGEDGMQHVSPESRLATYLENKEDENLVTASDDWLTTVRN